MLPQDGMENEEIALSLDDMHINRNNRSPGHLPLALNSNSPISPTIYDQTENNFVSPSVRVKHSITYGYDERRFQIFQNEDLFLINKTNQDWWLCLRLDENQTFFVPASYLEELDTGHRPNIIPPPRPPPPPPQLSSADRSSVSSTKSNKAAMTAAAVAAAAATTPASTFSTFTDYSQLTSRLKNSNSKPEVKARQLLNYTNNNSTQSNSSSTFSSDSKANKRSTYQLITCHAEDNDSSVNSSSTDNNVVMREKNVPGSMTDDSTDSIINEDYYTEADQGRYEEEPVTYSEVEHIIKNTEDDNHHYENLPVIRRISNTNLTNRKGVINTSTDNELDDQQSRQQIPLEMINNSVQQSEEESPSKAEDNDEDTDPLMLGIDIPEGWLKDTEKKYFYNQINDEKWFMTYDSNQKPYFYNYEGKAIWRLEELPEREDPHFQKNFDNDLSSFKQIHSRYSTRQVSSDSNSSTPQVKTPPKALNISRSSNSTTNNKTPQTVDSQLSRVAPTGLNANFRIVKITEKGKKCKKKTIENYRIHLASTTFLLISTKNGVEKLDLPLDLKRESASCYKVEIPRNSNSSNSGSSSSTTNGSKDSNNNPSKNEKIKLQLKFGRKDKDLDEFCDFIGMNKCGFVLETASGYKLLIIHETESVVNEWVSEINSIISQNVSLLGSPESIAQPVSDKSDSRKSFKSPNSNKVNEDETYDSFDKSGETVEIRFRKNSDPEKANFLDKFKKSFHSSQNRLSIKRKKIESTNVYEDLPPLPKRPPPITDNLSVNHYSVMKSTIIKGFLDSFLNRRPTYTELKKHGILEECVYGANLINLCNRDRRLVPLFVTDIIQEIENKGLDMDGIYRISGNLAEVQKVRIQVDQGKHNFKDFDIHVLCGAFKTFFRELEEPLIPENLHESFLYYITVTDQTKRFENIQELIRQMPMAHRETMRTVCEHLLKVVERSSENRMTVQNVALVFGPNIIRSNPIINSNQGFNPHIMTQNVLVEYILKNFRVLYSFNEENNY